MKTRLAILLLVIVALALPLAAEEKAETEYVSPPETIINDNVPKIPVTIKEKMKQYSQMKSTFFLDWDPRGEGMLVTSLAGNTYQVFKLDKPGGELKQLTSFEEPVKSAVYCPDPKKHYFIFTKDAGGGEKYQYYTYDLKTGKHSLLTDGKSRHMGLTFNRTGDKIAFVNNSRTGMLFDVYTMDPEKADSKKLIFEAKRPAYYIPSGFSYDGSKLFVVEYISINEVNSWVIDLKAGKAELIKPGCKGKCSFMLGTSSKDGKTYYGLSNIFGEFNKMIAYDVATGKTSELTKDINWGIDEVANDKELENWAFTVNEEGFETLYIMDPATFKYDKVESLPVGLLSGVDFHPKKKSLSLTINGPRMNSDVFEYDIASGKLIRWTTSDTAGLDPSKFVEPELIKFPTFDKVDGKQRMIPAFYYKPDVEKGKKLPVIIYIHGGPEGQFRPGFSTTSSYWVNELGIAMIATNVRGSSGYGKTYSMLDNWEKREDSVKDIEACLDWIDKQPELDNKRIAVYGGSYGGYMVLASMFKFSDRLACGVDIVGISNFVTFLKNTSDYRRDLRRAEYGDERKIGDFLNKISPSTNAHKIKIPLFVIQGKNDPRVPWTEAEQIVKTVRKNGVPVWYQMATNEGHGFGKKDNRDFMNYSVVKFFQEYLLK